MDVHLSPGRKGQKKETTKKTTTAVASTTTTTNTKLLVKPGKPHECTLGKESLPASELGGCAGCAPTNCKAGQVLMGTPMN